MSLHFGIQTARDFFFSFFLFFVCFVYLFFYNNCLKWLLCLPCQICLHLVSARKHAPLGRSVSFISPEEVQYMVDYLSVSVLLLPLYAVYPSVRNYWNLQAQKRCSQVILFFACSVLLRLPNNVLTIKRKSLMQFSMYWSTFQHQLCAAFSCPKLIFCSNKYVIYNWCNISPPFLSYLWRGVSFHVFSPRIQCVTQKCVNIMMLFQLFLQQTQTCPIIMDLLLSFLQKRLPELAQPQVLCWCVSTMF